MPLVRSREQSRVIALTTVERHALIAPCSSAMRYDFMRSYSISSVTFVSRCNTGWSSRAYGRDSGVVLGDDVWVICTIFALFGLLLCGDLIYTLLQALSGELIKLSPLIFCYCCVILVRFTSQKVELALQGHPHKGGPTPSFDNFQWRPDGCIEYAQIEERRKPIGFLGSMASAFGC